MDLEWVKWGYSAIALPVLSGLGAWLVLWWRRRRALLSRIDWLNGLPADMQAVLDGFESQQVHTLRHDPNVPAMQWLIRKGVLERGSRAGEYEAVDCYVSVAAEWQLAVGCWHHGLLRPRRLQG